MSKYEELCQAYAATEALEWFSRPKKDRARRRGLTAALPCLAPAWRHGGTTLVLPRPRWHHQKRCAGNKMMPKWHHLFYLALPTALPNLMQFPASIITGSRAPRMSGGVISRAKTRRQSSDSEPDSCRKTRKLRSRNTSAGRQFRVDLSASRAQFNSIFPRKTLNFAKL